MFGNYPSPWSLIYNKGIPLMPIFCSVPTLGAIMLSPTDAKLRLEAICSCGKSVSYCDFGSLLFN